MDYQTFTLSWEVTNFSLLIGKRGRPIKSDRFHTGIEYAPTFIANFYPRDPEDPDFISLLLILQSKGKERPAGVEVSVTFQIVAPDGTPANEVHLTEDVRELDTFGIKKFSSRREVVERYLHNDTLKMQCVFRKYKVWNIYRLFARSAEEVYNFCQEWPLNDFSLTKGEVYNDFVRKEFLYDFSFNVRLSVEGEPGREVVIIEFTKCCEVLGERLSLNALITVLDADGTESEIWKQDRHFFHMRTLEEVWRFPTFIAKAPLLRQKDKYLPNDVLTLKCEIAVTAGNLEPLKHNLPSYRHVEVGSTPSSGRFVEDMTDLYNSKRFADVKLRVLGETVLAHKFVLQSRSKIFAEMLENVGGTDSDVLDVPDVDVITLKRMLKYMYTDEKDHLEYDDAVVDYVTAYK